MKQLKKYENRIKIIMYKFLIRISIKGTDYFDAIKIVNGKYESN